MSGFREKLGRWAFALFYQPVRLGVLLLAIGGLWIGLRYTGLYYLSPFSYFSRQVTSAVITVNKGAPLKEVGELLARHRLIRSAGAFTTYARWKGDDRKIKAGSYRISSSMSTREILDTLISGQVLVRKVTIPEGYTTSQIADLLAARGIVDRKAFLRAVGQGNFDFPYLDGAPAGARRLEGFLFPATYQFRAGMTAEQVIQQLLDGFQMNYTPELRHRSAEMGLTTRQVITLASLVEREAKLADERPLVAAVFLNRLKIGMRLESCATIQYILGHQKERLTYADLKIPSPYNTYLNDGLPPGPIANPGLASIKAVLYPAQVNYLYFVARGDGSHVFSLTLKDHDAAARRYVGN